MMRALSISAIDNYRKNAKQHADIDLDVLKIRINCLVDACETSKNSLRGKIYQFGKCVITVNDMNIITDIKWTDEKARPSNHEVGKLKHLYKVRGLNSQGSAFLNK